MSNLSDVFEKAFKDGGLDLRMLMERYSLRFHNLSLDDVRYIESECRDLRRRFENSEKVDCYKTTGLFPLGFADIAYFSIEETDLVKQLASGLIEKGNFNFEIKKLSISKDVLTGHIKDRKEWEKI